MKAIYYEGFREAPVVTTLPDPKPRADAVIVEVKASGLCLSDWHGWMGHDRDIVLPHVPGHELAGEVVEIGSAVERIKKGMRVTVPFVGGCGKCVTCASGKPQICPNQFQPGFTHWGSFATYVSIHYADYNLVELPTDYSYITAASLGCRFTTAFRAVVDRAQIKKGEWVAIIGAGGVGLSTLMIARAIGAMVMVVDPKKEARDMALALGADIVSKATTSEEIRSDMASHGLDGVDISIDAYGSSHTCRSAIDSLKRGGRHVQVGLINDEGPILPVSRMIAEEIVFMGSHGIKASRILDVFKFIDAHSIDLSDMIHGTCSLELAASTLPDLNQHASGGIVIIDQFG